MDYYVFLSMLYSCLKVLGHMFRRTRTIWTDDNFILDKGLTYVSIFTMLIIPSCPLLSTYVYTNFGVLYIYLSFQRQIVRCNIPQRALLLPKNAHIALCKRALLYDKLLQHNITTV